MAGFSKDKASRIFATAADAGSLLMALIYISYVGLLLALKIGYTVLNYCMLGVTVAYVLFFMFKIFYLNRLNPKMRLRRVTNIAYRYTKFSMRLINAAFVIISIINMRAIDENNFVALIGMVILGITFVISLLWDLITFFIRRKVKEIKDSWNSLSDEEKKEKIDFIISSFVRSLDSITGLDFEAGMNARKLMDERIKVVETKLLESSQPEVLYLPPKKEKKSLMQKIRDSLKKEKPAQEAPLKQDESAASSEEDIK